MSLSVKVLCKGNKLNSTLACVARTDPRAIAQSVSLLFEGASGTVFLHQDGHFSESIYLLIGLMSDLCCESSDRLIVALRSNHELALVIIAEK